VTPCPRCQALRGKIRAERAATKPLLRALRRARAALEYGVLTGHMWAVGPVRDCRAALEAGRRVR